MPELPEVETTVRDLRPLLVGHTITGAAVHWRRTIAQPNARVFSRDLVGFTIRAITRRGKFLVFDLGRMANESATGDGPQTRYLLVHLRMTGGFRFHPAEDKRDKHVHVALRLEDGRELRFRDPRKFGRMWLVDDPLVVTGRLGPDPFEITPAQFRARLEQRRGQIKPLLLNQTFLAGIGNIYADESLWYARIHPQRQVSTFDDQEIRALYRSIRLVLRKAIGVGGTSFDVNYRRIDGMTGEYQEDLRVVGREGEPCRRCSTPIVKIVVGQRGTYYCPHCQKL